MSGRRMMLKPQKPFIASEDKCAKLTEDLATAELMLQKSKSLKDTIDAKHTAAQEKCQKMVRKYDRLKASILGRASNQFAEGFVKAKEQIRIVDPNFDLSRIGFLKEIKDDQKVGDDDVDLDLLPKFDSESESEEEEENGDNDGDQGGDGGQGHGDNDGDNDGGQGQGNNEKGSDATMNRDTIANNEDLA